MTELLCGVVGILILIVLILVAKIYYMQKSMKEIEEAFADRVISDTNMLIDISSHDKYVRSLANAINRELRKLRRQRHRFVQGDMELKNAVTNISHDLRTPLTAIYGYLELLEKEEKSEAVERYIEIIGNRVEMLKQLTEELFRYSMVNSMDIGEMSPVSINRILEESIAAFYILLKERNIEPEICMPEEGVIREVDKSALSRVFANLLNNAIKYSDGDLEIVLTEKGEIIISNTASELNEVEVGKLFHRFYTVDNAHKSTGLGLSIARTLIEQMGGTINAYYANKKLFVKIYL
ncbi:MAG: HAMP domain-containing histidine kinase [Lachnospiraceae bacterium]|nr:HAMP domain-containing histidine kinase [Lachnospiraceae bacterium]